VREPQLNRKPGFKIKGREELELAKVKRNKIYGAAVIISGVVAIEDGGPQN